MSRAFVKEAEDQPVEAALPDRLVSPHTNLVTPEGLAAIEAEAEAARRALSAAQAEQDRAAIARAGRDLRYWSSRRATAQVMEPPADADRVHFGSTVTIERDDGRTQTFRIVGEDEADPTHGLISYVSPMARALTDKAVGDEVKVADSEVEIVSIN